MSRRKLIAFWAVLFALVLATPPILLGGYYAVRKFTFAYQFCGSYGELDPVLGWRLKAGVRSCLTAGNRITGETFFESRIDTDRSGFRNSQVDVAAPVEAIVAIGDSWTFGYGVDYEQSYPYLLSQAINRPVVNAAVPAYGSAQMLLLFERNVLPLRPKAVVYLTLGLWNRSICEASTRPTKILKPCFWWNPGKGQIELVAPARGYVEAMAANGVYPGGYLTAGFDSWSYFLISRPFLVIREYLTRIGLLTGGQKGDVKTFDVEAMLQHELSRYLRLARDNKFVFVLIDVYGSYSSAVAKLSKSETRALVYIGTQRWHTEVDNPARALPPAQRTVPHDGHFGAGTNRLIAAMLAKVLREKYFSN